MSGAITAPTRQKIVQIWNGGLAIYGGIIGALIGAAIGCKVGKIDFRNLLDLGLVGLLIGQGIGRWGNFFNQEAFWHQYGHGAL